LGVGARIAIERLGRGGDTTKRVLGGGVVNRFEIWGDMGRYGEI
jgi:hypothetical protein